MPSDHNDKREEQLTPQEKQTQGFSQQFAMAMELPFVIVAAVVVGGLFGYLLDRWFHTKPILMAIFGFLGFFAGVREILRRLPADDDGKPER
ncbi:MAG TPA: AtpZ/AtpI family protein [Verrucomicrobiae bacterium]|nr:AtpZ/AtpI family protein [Verrucomicrobiae bacterium]